MNHKKKKKSNSTPVKAKVPPVDSAPSAVVVSGARPETMASIPASPGIERATIPAILFGIAFILSIYLGWQSIAGKTVAGCGPGSGCGQILKSRWSAVLGVPVSLLGAGAYIFLLAASLCPGFSRQWGLWERGMSILVLGGALWFTIVQAFILRSFCPWCCATHFFACAAVIVLWMSRSKAPPFPGSGRGAAVASLIPLAAITGMIVLQSTAAEAERIEERKLSSVVTAGGGGSVVIHGGKMTLDSSALPSIGMPGAGVTAVALVDFTCPHCRELHRTLGELAGQHPGLFNIVLLPGAFEPDAQEIHRIMLALWRIDPVFYHKLADELMDGSVNAVPHDVLEAVQTRLKGKFYELAWPQSGWVQDTMRQGEDLLALNTREAKASTLPQIMIRDRVVTGSPRPETLLGWFEGVAGTGAGNQMLAASPASPDKIPAHTSPAPLPGNPGADSGPEIAFESKTVDLGTVVKGQPVKKTITFVNTGKAPLTLKTVKAGCGCTTIDGGEQTVAPGQQGAFQVKLDTERFFGEITKTIDVESNAPSGTVRLFLKADVWCPVTLSASVVSFAPVLKGAKVIEPRTIDLTVSEPEPLKIAGVTCNNPFFKAELKPVEEGRRYQLTVSALGAAVSLQNADLTLDLGHPKLKELRIPVYLNPAEPVIAQPMQVNISVSDLQLRSSAVISVSCSDTAVTQLEVSGVSYSGGGGAGVSFERVAEDARLGRVILTLPAGYTPPPANDAFVSFHTNHPANPDFKIPVRFTPARTGVLSGGSPQ